jgi:hypothetical protein
MRRVCVAAALACAGALLLLRLYNPFNREFRVEEYADPLAGLWDTAGRGVEPFSLSVPDAVLAEQQALLAASCFAGGCARGAPGGTPQLLPAGDKSWSYGIQHSYLQEVVQYWRSEYDWRAEEARLNAQPQFTVVIAGLTVHFLHFARPAPEGTATALPILLLHGRMMHWYPYR